jgi:glycosyltransferase involved in cell wall biosynthesis
VARLGRLLEGPLARAAYRHHACVAVSPSTVAAMRDQLRWPGDIYLIPNGVGMPPPRPASGGEEAGDCPAALVWVGRLVAHKRADLVLPIAERLAGAGVTIDVVGRGPAAQALAASVAERGLAGQVRLRGFLPEAAKQAIVAAARLHLNTSLGEGWGLCVLEAAALGVPTVAFDVAGLRDAVRDGETGWLARGGERIEDVTQRAVKELADPVRRAEIAAACRAWAAQLSWDAATARMATLLSACLQSGTSRASRPGAWIMSSQDGGLLLAEGPVLDILVSDGSATPLRPATPLERLLGRAIAEPGRPR